MKSRKHLKRRKITKQKTFKFEREDVTSTIKGLTEQTALNKLFRIHDAKHQGVINTLDKSIKKFTNNLTELEDNLSSYISKMSLFVIILNAIKRMFDVKNSANIQENIIDKQSETLKKEIKKHKHLEFSRPYLNEYKIVF